MRFYLSTLFPYLLDRTHAILDSDDGHAQHYAPSVNSHMSVSPQPGLTGYSDPYPAWSADKQIPISYEEIEDIFLDLTQKFGFQRDSMRNQVRCFFRGTSITIDYSTPV